jgi:hypothetical protein
MDTKETKSFLSQMQAALSLLPRYEHADGYVGETMVVRAKAEEVLNYWTEYANKEREKANA